MLNFLKIGQILPDKKVFKMLFGMSTIVLQWSQGLVLIIFRDKFSKSSNFSLALLIKVLLIKQKACNKNRAEMSFLYIYYKMKAIKMAIVLLSLFLRPKDHFSCPLNSVHIENCIFHNFLSLKSIIGGVSK